MTQFKTEPEYILAESSEKTSPRLVLSRTSGPTYMDLVEDLEVLSRQLAMAIGTSKRIHDSVRGLELSLVEQL